MSRYHRRRRSGTSATNSLIGGLIMIPIQIAWFIIVFVAIKVFFAMAIALVGISGRAIDTIAAKWSRRSLPPS